MTLNQLVLRAATVYPDGQVLDCWDSSKQRPRRSSKGGDTLALFIARELADTYDSEADDGTQIATAAKAMQTATDDLQAVAQSLSDLAVERMAA